jgi:aldehyde:ferredoxin oxidoreductase
MIARREGFGNVLADGTRRIAARYGADDLALHVNGLEPPAWDPRAASGMAVVYATSPRGACHMQGDMYMVDLGLTLPEVGVFPGGRFRTRGKSKIAARLQDWRTLYNSAIMCVFVNPTPPILVKLLSQATGWSSDITWWQHAGERIFNLKRAFNNRLGINRGNDRIPERLRIPMSNGSMGRTPRMEMLIEEYYAHRDWDWATGQPSRDKLISLGLPEIAEELWGGA